MEGIIRSQNGLVLSFFHFIFPSHLVAPVCFPECSFGAEKRLECKNPGSMPAWAHTFTNNASIHTHCREEECTAHVNIHTAAQTLNVSEMCDLQNGAFYSAIQGNWIELTCQTMNYISNNQNPILALIKLNRYIWCQMYSITEKLIWDMYLVLITV